MARLHAVLLLAVVALATRTTAVSAATPNYQGCIADAAKSLPYCDTTKSHEERVADLIGRLNLTEKISLIAPAMGMNTCNEQQLPIDRIGYPAYMWLDETNTAVASVCVAQDRCATSFIGPEGLGAAFNRSAWFVKGDVLSTEFRAFNSNGGYRGQGTGDLIGFTGFGCVLCRHRIQSPLPLGG